MHDKESGRLTGAMSFIKVEGEPVFSEEECHHMAIRFYSPCFRKRISISGFNMMNRMMKEKTWDLHIRLVRAALICDSERGESVSAKDGSCHFYMPPEIDPKELQEIDPVPSLTMEEAKDAIRRAIKAELAWDRCYDDDSCGKVYRLVYKPVFPRFIEAHTGEAIMSLIG